MPSCIFLEYINGRLCVKVTHMTWGANHKQYCKMLFKRLCTEADFCNDISKP